MNLFIEGIALSLLKHCSLQGPSLVCCGLFSEEIFGENVPQDENLPTSYLPTCPVGRRTTDVPHPLASTLISAPPSNKLGHQSILQYVLNSQH